MEQKPSLGRIVIFTAFRGHEQEKVDEYAAIVTKVHDADTGIIDLCTFGSNSVYFQHSVPKNNDGLANTWRWPTKT